MAPRIDSKKIKDIATKPIRKKVSLFLSEDIYNEFVKNCEAATISVVLEELMKAFNEDAESGQVKQKSAHKK